MRIKQATSEELRLSGGVTQLRRCSAYSSESVDLENPRPRRRSRAESFVDDLISDVEDVVERCCWCCCLCCSCKCFWLTLLGLWIFGETSAEILTQIYAVEWEDLALTYNDFTELPADVFMHSAFAIAAYETPSGVAKEDGNACFEQLRGYSRVMTQWKEHYQIYQKDDDANNYIVCARGTSQKCDIMQDIGIAFGNGPEERVKYVKKHVCCWLETIKDTPAKVSFAGHSLGGSVAMLAFDEIQEEGRFNHLLTKSYSFNPGVSFQATNNDVVLTRIITDKNQVICMVDDDWVCDSLQIVLCKLAAIDVKKHKLESLHVINGLAFHRRWSRISYVIDLPIRCVQWTYNWITGQGNLLPDRIELHLGPAFYTPTNFSETRTYPQIVRYLRFEKELTAKNAFPTFGKFDHKDYPGQAMSRIQRILISNLTTKYKANSRLLEQFSDPKFTQGRPLNEISGWRQHAQKNLDKMVRGIVSGYIARLELDEDTGKTLPLIQRLRKLVGSKKTR